MTDTTGHTPGCAYVYFDSTPIPPVGIVWFCTEADHWGNVAMPSPRVLNLWSLTGGSFDVTRTIVFPAEPGDTLSATASLRRAGAFQHCSVRVSGSYSGPQNLISMGQEQGRWHQIDSATMLTDGEAVALTSTGDTVVGHHVSVYTGLRRQLNFDQVVELSFPQCRVADGFLAFTWHGMADSTTSAVAEPGVASNPRILSLKVTPNPATRYMAVNFSLSRPGFVSLKLYDATGRCISVLRVNRVPAGEYSTRLDAGLIPRGVYLLKLDANGGTLVRKVVVD